MCSHTLCSLVFSDLELVRFFSSILDFFFFRKQQEKYPNFKLLWILSFPFAAPFLEALLLCFFQKNILWLNGYFLLKMCDVGVTVSLEILAIIGFQK